jgi:hypothetical protein
LQHLTNMAKLLVFLLLFQYNASAQIKPGTFKEVSDTLYIGKAWAVSWSQIVLNNDNTFIYHHRTSEGCLMWYDTRGTWFTKSNKLYLVDTALAQNGFYDTLTLFRTTVFKIKKDGLTLFNAYFDGDKASYSPMRTISGNFIRSQNE